MGVVELDGRIFGQMIPTETLMAAEIAHNVLQRRAGEDILLLDAQALALPRGVVGVEDAGDVLGLVFVFERLIVVLCVERIEVQLLLGFALPETERADGLGVVADDRHIVGYAVDGLVGELDFHGQLIAAVAPGVAVFRPVIGVFTLTVVFKRLLEQAEAIAQAVSHERQI